ncbi:leucyl aminopeptidase [Corynebacterium bovis]|uniref:leucyl aminopeptidase n=1 Tax=Corynebacterium bovis TaxID=36808 RepID=UPI003138E712
MASDTTSLPLPARGAVPHLALADSVPTGPDGPDTLVVPVFTGESGIEVGGTAASPVPEPAQVELWKMLVAVGATGSRGEVTTLPAVEGTDVTTILAVGLGDADTVTSDDIRAAAGTASRSLRSARHVASLLGLLDLPAAVEGHALGAYRYDGQKAADPDRTDVGTVTVVGRGEDAAERFTHACAVVEAVTLARDLVNAPANALYPESYAEVVRAATTGTGVEVEVLDDHQLEEQGFGGIVGVGRGSARPPRLVRMTWSPERDRSAGDGDAADGAAPTVALVGKGITFDTGGISLKPGASMDAMISDMGGSAAVIASVIAAAKLDLPLTVTATVPLAENMPDGNATRPGDVLRHYNGTTTEVLNTDAEGRLVLADAIARACEDNPRYLIETATLTGAQLVALGDRTPGIMGSPAFRDAVAGISREVGENAWPMPLPPELNEALTSDVADIRNISGSRSGGMLVAGHYLGRFVTEGVEWVHIDVAGPAYNTGSAYGYTPKRGTGVPVRTIIATLEWLAAGGTTADDGEEPAGE